MKMSIDHSRFSLHRCSLLRIEKNWRKEKRLINRGDIWKLSWAEFMLPLMTDLQTVTSHLQRIHGDHSIVEMAPQLVSDG